MHVFSLGVDMLKLSIKTIMIEETVELIPGGLIFGRLYITSATTVGHNWKYLLKVVVLVLVLLGLFTAGVWCFISMDGKLFSQYQEKYTKGPNCNPQECFKKNPHNHL